jgi:hypothetical protein
MTGTGPGDAVPLGSSFGVLGADDDENNLSISVTVGGVPWQPPISEGNETAILQSRVGPITGAGTYSAPFEFEATFTGVPASLPQPQFCNDQCTTWFIGGVGTMVTDVVPLPGFPNNFYIDKATLTFGAPEPSTASLLLLGFAGLAILGWRRRSRATLIQTG